MLIDWNNLNYIAIIVGGVLYMLYGTIYYSVLLSDKKGSKNKEFIENQSEGSAKYVFSVIIAFINSFLVALLVQASGADNWLEGVGVGLIIGILISIVYLKNSLFGLISKKAFLIAIGDHLIIFSLLGGLHGLFI
ncbi:DUF1761 domain-containing protein [Metabacillus litoralis]|jgi:hypothetical protein|uniref:DUF1761 domain-containing protein n=1 Tax=Metabacillus litoralis TaxID=152268 RepID=UPI002040228B|nr:DUF1761 domain-containing protein [Metabacillus litoralis]MCM3651743.1 DUF1761 domain-containing protein [Metabacillus litoralis]